MALNSVDADGSAYESPLSLRLFAEAHLQELYSMLSSSEAFLLFCPFHLVVGYVWPVRLQYCLLVVRFVVCGHQS